MKAKAIVLTAVVAAIILTVGVTSYALATIPTALQTVEQPKPVKVLSKYETGPPDPQELLELVNKERAKVGVAPLKLDARLNRTAQMKADDMVANNYYNHVSPITGKHGYELVFDNYPTLCSLASENLLKTTGTTETSYGAVEGDGWVSSPKHYSAMINKDYTLVGFAYSGGYTVAHFCKVY